MLMPLLLLLLLVIMFLMTRFSCEVSPLLTASKSCSVVDADKADAADVDAALPSGKFAREDDTDVDSMAFKGRW